MSVEAPPRPRAFLTPRGVILAIVLAGLLFSAMYPMRRTLDARARIAELQSEATVLEERVVALSEQKAILSSDEEVERLAREDLQMVRPGEVAFVIVTPKPTPAAQPVGPGGFEPPVRRRASLVGRWWEAARRAASALR